MRFMPEQFSFSGLRELFAKANEEKSGDQLAGIAAGSERERIAAKRELADLSLDEIVRQPLIDPDDDDVSKLILESFDREAFMPIKSSTVGEFREFLLDDATGEAELKRIHRAIIPEIAAAVTKIMSNKDLVLTAGKIRNVTRCRNTMGERGVLGIRIQPNHPTDDIAGILLSAFEGLLYGCGDAVIGVNPASDGVGELRRNPARTKPSRGYLQNPDANVLPCAHFHATGRARPGRTDRSVVPIRRWNRRHQSKFRHYSGNVVRRARSYHRAPSAA
jgi:ethanolamine ammonia-lyase large subunit